MRANTVGRLHHHTCLWHIHPCNDSLQRDVSIIGSVYKVWEYCYHTCIKLQEYSQKAKSPCYNQVSVKSIVESASKIEEHIADVLKTR